MRLLGIALAAVASTFLASSAYAQSAPTPADLARELQNAASTLQAATASCPTIEIAPGVRIPICANNFPKPPPGIVLPEAQLGAVNVLPWVDLRRSGLDGPVMNQQQTGVCYAFAVTDVLDNSLRRQGRQDSLSPLHLIASGGYGQIFRDTPGEALTREASWPYDPIKACKLKAESDTCEGTYGVRTNSWQSDPVIVGERERARRMGAATIQKASALTKDPVGGIVNALSANRAVYLVIGIDSTAWSYSNVKDGRLRDYNVADRGDHAVAIAGYRSMGSSREFLLHNSWGASWGDHGYVWITEPALRKHLTSAYLIEAVPAGSVPSLPLPPPALALPAFPFPVPALVPPSKLPWPFTA